MSGILQSFRASANKAIDKYGSILRLPQRSSPDYAPQFSPGMETTSSTASILCFCLGTDKVSPESRYISVTSRLSAQEALTEIASRTYIHRAQAILGAPTSIKVKAAKQNKESPGSTPNNETECITTVASYSHKDGSISLTDNVRHDPVTIPGTMFHELMHAWQFRQGDIVGRVWADNNIAPPAENTYAKSSVIEHQAEAGAIALCILEGPHMNPNERIAVAVHYDKEVPGVIVMLRLFLTHPLYNDHSLKAIPQFGPLPDSPAWEESVHIPHLSVSRMSASCAIGKEYYYDKPLNPEWPGILRQYRQTAKAALASKPKEPSAQL